jgi:hypothetical protein
MSSTLYARVSDEAYAYVKAESERSGMPLAQVVDAFLAEAMRLEWHVGGRVITVEKQVIAVEKP